MISEKSPNPPNQFSCIQHTKTDFKKESMTTVYVSDIKANFKFATPCVICGESVELSDSEALSHYVFKVCDKCKNAVMLVRKQIEEYNRTNGVCLD